MEKGRLEAFTDGVMAVIITIMMLELRPPHEATWPALLGNGPVYASVAIAFAFCVPVVSCAPHAAVAVIWIVPDRRIEKHVTPNPWPSP